MKKEKKAEKKPIYALLYARTVNMDAEGPNQSIQKQLGECRSFAKARGYIVEKDATFTEDSSGLVYYTEREGLQGILARIDKFPERAFVVIVNDISRIARNITNYDAYCAVLGARGVSLVSANTTGVEDTPEEKLKRDITMIMGRYEFNKRSERAFQAIRRKAGK